MTDLLSPAAAAFLLGLFRGLSICLFLCAPGMIPLLVSEKAGLGRSLWLGFLLSLPRLIFLTALGALLGFVSFEVVNSPAFHGTLFWINVVAYILLGLLLVLLGGRMLGQYGDDVPKAEGPAPKKGKRKSRAQRKGRAGPAREPRPSAWTRLWMGLADRLYPRKGRSEAFFLLWGGLLSLACLAEVTFLEGAAISALAGTGTDIAAASAGFGALMMFFFALGATVPILAAAAVGGGIVAGVKDRRRLETIRGVLSVLMVLLGLYFIFREAYSAVTALGWY